MINFADALEKHVIAENEKSAWGRDDKIGTYHASAVGMCEFQLFRAKTGMSKPNVATLKTFYIGKI